jgi:pyruvate dehydrogenase E2 component (dihydrolipoamide acetyltransferase)
MAVEIVMPRLTDTMLEGSISYWYCKEGDTISKGAPLFLVETDKAAVEVEASTSGVLLKILVREGETTPVGSTVAIIGEAGENIDASLEPTSAQFEKKTNKTESNNKHFEGEIIKASPAAKAIAKSKNIDLSRITGTGNNGMISKKDIEDYLEKEGKTPSADSSLGDDERIELKGIPKAMAKKMALTITIPQVTTIAEVDATQLKYLSKQSSISITSFVAWAVVLGLKSYPIINASLDVAEETVIVKKQYNIGVSVATPGGLIVPNIKNAERKDIYTITESLAELVKKGRENRLRIDDISDGTFTITNSGIFGSLFFTPRINPPECAILGMGKIMEQPVVVEKQITIRSMMYLALSYDHRVIDGENAVKFLQEIKKALEEPGKAFARKDLK